jgi:hypothetical protein
VLLFTPANNSQAKNKEVGLLAVSPLLVSAGQGDAGIQTLLFAATLEQSYDN